MHTDIINRSIMFEGSFKGSQADVFSASISLVDASYDGDDLLRENVASRKVWTRDSNLYQSNLKKKAGENTRIIRSSIITLPCSAVLLLRKCSKASIFKAIPERESKLSMPKKSRRPFNDCRHWLSMWVAASEPDCMRMTWGMMPMWDERIYDEDDWKAKQVNKWWALHTNLHWTTVVLNSSWSGFKSK